MPTYTAQMPTKHPRKRLIKSSSTGGYTFFEMIVVLGIVALLAAIVVINFAGSFSSSSFKTEALEIVNTLKMAANGASQTGRRYAVMFDFVEQTYTLQEVKNLEELADTTLEAADRVISTTLLSERCKIEFITFDDMTDTRDVGTGEIEDQLELKSYFVAGRTGWQNGGKIGLTDIDGNEYSIIINRISKNVKLEDGNIDSYFLEPKENLQF